MSEDKLFAHRVHPEPLRTLQGVRRTRVDWHCQSILGWQSINLPVYLRTGGYTRQLQPMSLRDGSTEWADSLFHEDDVVECLF